MGTRPRKREFATRKRQIAGRQIAEGTRIGNTKLRRGQGPARGPAVIGNQLSGPPGKGCQRMARTHHCWVRRTHQFQPRLGLTLPAVWALVFILTQERLPVANGSQINWFAHRRRARVKYKYKHSNASSLCSPTPMQTSLLASRIDCLYAWERRTSTNILVHHLPTYTDALGAVVVIN